MNTVNKNNYKIKQFIRTLYLSLVLVIVLKNPTFLFTISYLISTLITSVVLYGFIIFWSKLIYNWFSISIQASTFVNHPHLLYISYLYINCKQSEAIKIKFKNDKYFFANKKEKYYECIVDNNNRIIELTSLDQMVEALYTIRKATYVQYVK